jgi:hypothetical protein
MTPFDFINAILVSKKDLLKDDDQAAKEYAPFIVNRGLSLHLDCVLYANEMNLHPFIDKDQQYQFFLNSIRPMKRKFEPWQKSLVDKDIQCVKEFFGYNNQKAKDALSILSDEQIADIKIRIDKGGVKKS